MRKLHQYTLLLPRFGRYLLVGIVMLIVGAVTLDAFMGIGLSASVAFFARMSATSPTHYLLHRLVTWHDKRHDSVPWQKCRYAAMKIATTFMGFGIYEFLMLFELRAVWANAVSYVVVGLVQYGVNNRAVFATILQKPV